MTNGAADGANTQARVDGDGRLAAAVRRSLTAGRAGRTSGAELVVACFDSRDPAAVLDAARAAHQAGVDFLPVHPTPRGVRIGPWTTAGQPGCHQCVVFREEHALGAEQSRASSALGRAVSAGTVAVPAAVLVGPVVTVVAGLVADHVARADGETLAQAVLDVDTVTLEVTRHRFIADPECPTCGGLPDDGPDAGSLPLLPRPKARPESYRLRDLAAEHEHLVDVFVDPKLGLFSVLNVAHQHPMILTAALGGPVCCTELAGYGRTFTYPSSVAVAIAEALERLGGSRRARRTTVRASYRELGPERAVEPTELGLPAEPYGKDAVAYHPDLPIDWVYGYSFRRGGPVLVPETFVYYGGHTQGFGQESSNGCALGSSLEEAALYGIFEVAERDGFLATWFAQLPVPRIDPHTSDDPQTRLLVRWLERETGCRLYVFDTTMPEGVPSIWLMLVDESGRPDRPKAFCGGGAHLDPERALHSALVELATVARYQQQLLRDPERTAQLVADPDEVREMDDHGALAAAPQAWDRFGFLFQRTEVLSMAEAFPYQKRHQPAADLRDDLLQTVSRYVDGGSDVIVVDQTSREQAEVDLACVRVIIPGTLPMVFGHRNRRVDLARFREIPVRLGYRDTPLHPSEVNPHPHPFP
ncbi:TOMM precursor leader peptide-binding protein [Micromonospora sp. NPDC047074]|uniref:TOMM precursor leader peptide-binding protein n=1 Tax=Micromonospora sp. NPDC047074 TaxID=3154339 RepID=UPI003403B194